MLLTYTGPWVTKCNRDEYAHFDAAQWYVCAICSRAVSPTPTTAAVYCTVPFPAIRWNDDVVFKGQARTEPEQKKRFVNDTIRNDFHRRFLTKYIK